MTRENEFWKGKRVLVTGGAGFVGSAVVQNLITRRGVPRASIVVPRSADCDLRYLENSERAVDGCDIVIHLAARTGGIAYSRSHPASQYLDCSLINLNILEAARKAEAEKVIAIGNLLAYPAVARMPLVEAELFNGPIADTHLGIGLSKRDLVTMAQMFHCEYQLDVGVVLSANAYGPRDRFEPGISHVIPATILKCFEQPELVVWGDGSPTRDFLYVDDIAEGVLLATERLKGPQFVNLSSGSETSIRDLVLTIARLTGFQGPVSFDATKGGGDPRRTASAAKAAELLGFEASVSLEDGLRRTIEWYRSERSRGVKA